MKKNVKKLNKKLKAILCLCLALLFSFSAFLFAGCDKDIGNIGGGSGSGGGSGGGENQRTFFENYVSGIAAVYANSESGGDSGLAPSQNQTNKMLRIISNGLLSNYGSGKDIDTYRYSAKAPFYDSIRMLVTNDNGYAKEQPNLPNRWSWSLNPNLQNNKNITPKENEEFSAWINRITNKSGNESPDDFFYKNYNFDIFTDAFQIVLYEIMLGYEPTTLKVTVDYDCRPPSDSKFALVSASGTLYSVEILRSSNTELNESKLYWHWQENSGEALDKIKPDNADKANKKLRTYLYGEGGEPGNPTGGLAKEYLEKSRYVGLTKQNADKLIDYILTEIIGTNLVLHDYNTYKNKEVNFRNYVSTIAYLIYSQTYDGSNEDWVYNFPSGNEVKISYTFNQDQRKNAKDNGLLNKIDERGSFMSKPATYVKYFPGESFFGDPDATNQFAGKPYAEYQSIVIVPAISAETTKDGGIKLEAGFVFNFMTQNKNLRIIPKVRYCVYNEETGTQFFYEFAADEINFSGAQSFVNAAGQTCYEDDFDFGVDISKLDPSLVKTQVDSTGYKETTYTVGFFKNKELLDSVVDETRLTEQAGVQNFYKVVESKNGHGGTTVLNEKHIKSSFFEIVFDIVKSETDPENTDYNFSLVLSNSLLYPGIY